MEQETLIALVKRAQSGDSEAMERLLVSAHTSVSYQCRKFMKTPEDAEDLTQEVLLVIYQKLDTLTEPAAFHGWVKRIAATRCMNALSRTHVDLQFAEDEEGNSVLDSVEELDAQKIPDAAMDDAETARMVVELIDSLPETQRICTYLYYYDELSVKEIAELTATTENTVKSRLNYARKAIKEGVLDHEKKGIKLYGLSPLPFLLYYLGLAAQTEANEATAVSCVSQVMTASAAKSAAAATVATGKTSAAVKTATGFLAKKVIAGVVAGVLALGGGTFAAIHLINEHAETVPAVICRHEWKEATCTAPKTCGKCDSVEGAPLGHMWVDADCETAKTCGVCAATEGAALGHTWLDATCETAKTCAVCDRTEGDPLGHDMAEANYQAPATCKTCGYTEGNVLTPEFEKLGLPVVRAEMGKTYEYVASCYLNKEKKTVGELSFSGYRTFKSDAEHPAKEGFVWHTVDLTLTFSDQNAQRFGTSVNSGYCSYYSVSGSYDTEKSNEKTFSVNYNGIKHKGCMLRSSGYSSDGWIDNTYTFRNTTSWCVPEGYDGFILFYYDYFTEITNEQPFYTFLDENTLYFRFGNE